MLAAPVMLAAEQDTPLAPREDEALLARLDSAFRQSFAVIDLETDSLERVTSDWPGLDAGRLAPLCRYGSGGVEVLEDHAPLLVLAVPLPTQELHSQRVAVGALLTERGPSDAAIESASRVLGLDQERLAKWATGRQAWPAHAAIPLAEALLEAEAARTTAWAAESSLSEISAQLVSTFEELNLLHQLTEGLSLGRSERELAEQAVDRLGEVAPAECVVACLDAPGDAGPMLAGSRLPIETDELESFFDRLGPQAQRRAIVLNCDRTASPIWAHPGVRELVSAPIIANDRRIGWVALFNHRPPNGSTETGFGTVEASLLSSVATLLGVHAGNRTLFSEKSELFEGVVHSLTSAIDAKDPYTCGHSDRVARVAVRLAQQLGCTDEEINTIYLGGLLHDVGKIGIEDSVLRKPGALTDEEFALVKNHPPLGEQILRGVPQLAHVLPIVLHHHESWDGTGYPGGLVRDECPLLARITAVADAYDAMGSDRPYRKGMPAEKVESILLDGAGQQWDPRVVDAFFAAKEDIAAISRVEREPLDLDVSRWAVAEPMAQ